MKIALINNLYPPYILGGNEMLAHDVVQELRKRGHEVHVITGEGKEFKKEKWLHPFVQLDLDRKHESFLGQKEPTYWDLLNWHIFNWKTYRAVIRQLRAIDPHLVVAWNLYMASMAPLVAAARLRLPTVIHVCDKWLIYGLKDVTLLLPPVTVRGRLVGRVLRTIVHPSLRRVVGPDNIVAISEFMRDQYVEAGFAAHTISVIHLGVPTELFTRMARPIPSDDKIRLLYVGSLWEGKGPQVALRALGLLIRDIGRTRAHLDVYGEGTESFNAYVSSIVREERVEDCVTFHGFVGRQQIISAYQSHDILVFPSIWDEPFSAVLIEAMSCGIAIVATSAGGTPEAIIDGESALLVPPGDPRKLADAMGRLVRDGALRVKLGQRAARRARDQFDFAAYVNRLETHYTQVAGNQ